MSAVREEIAVAKSRPIRVVALTLVGVAIAVCTLFLSNRISAERRPISTGPVRVDPRLGIASARVAAKVKIDSLLFTGERFPQLDLQRPALVEEKMGECSVSATFFDRTGREMASPGPVGPYGAVVEITPKGQRPIRRFLTLYRMQSTLPLDWKFDRNSPALLAEACGLPISVVERHAEILAKKIKDRPYSEVVHDPGVARIFAGMALCGEVSGPAHPWNDAEAAERRWWLDHKRKSSGLNTARTPKYEIPKPVFGSPAQTIREGTLAEAGMRPGSDEAIDAVLKEWADDSDQAFAVCIVRKGVIVLHRAYGMRDGKPMTVHTKSWMASVTKPMSASLMMMLVDEGMVSLDDRIADILPQLRDLKSDRPTTIRNLYTHTHGMDFWLKVLPDDWPDVEERIADCYPSAHAGRNWTYNGVGYAVGGKIIETLTGETLPDFYRKHLLEPMEMNETDVSGTFADARSVPLDIAKFGQMLLNGGAYGDHRFFRPTTFRKMLPQRLVSELGPDTKKLWGIGLDGEQVRIGHGAASSATFRVDKTADLIVVMTRDKRGKNFEKYDPRFWDAIKAGIK